ncbi:MAG: hypothetical protein HYY18_06580 [Planctomycetes bacterium]|nr:hypothetical protein [Planctomycetota bacterium]
MRAAAVVLGCLFGGLSARADDADLERRLRALELEVEGPDPAGRGREPVEAWFDRGLRFKTADGFFRARLGGWLIAQAFFHSRLNERDAADTFRIKEATLELGARLDGSWEVFVSPVFLGGGSRLLYGWVEFNRWEWLRIRAGQFKEPFSMEVLEETRWWDFPENSVVYMQAPVPDIGIMAHGSVADGLVRYALGAFNGNGSGTSRDENSDKDLAARLAVHAADAIGWEPLLHLHAAVSATHGRQRRDAPATPFPMFDPTTGTVFHLNPAATGYEVEDVSRVGAEAAALAGPVELKSEFSWHRSRLDFGDARRVFRSTGWYAQAGVWLGGRRVPFGIPEVDDPLFGGGAGAFQFAVRYAHLRMDDDLEEHAGFTGARRVDEISAVLNWFPNANVLVSVEYVWVGYGHGRVVLPSGKDIDEEDVVAFRMQIGF